MSQALRFYDLHKKLIWFLLTISRFPLFYYLFSHTVYIFYPHESVSSFYLRCFLFLSGTMCTHLLLKALPLLLVYDFKGVT